VLTGVDGLRADRLSCYGYGRLTSPHPDLPAAQGVLVERCSAPSIPTTPAYASMSTGPDVMSTPMVALRPKEPLAEELRSLPRVLAERGHVSACVGFGGPQAERCRGFDRYANYRAWMDWSERRGDKAGKRNDAAIPLLDDPARPGQPLFQLLRHADPHAPFPPPAPFDRLFYSGDETDPAHLRSRGGIAPAPSPHCWQPTTAPSGGESACRPRISSTRSRLSWCRAGRSSSRGLF
jgi:hypothetical protein